MPPLGLCRHPQFLYLGGRRSPLGAPASTEQERPLVWTPTPPTGAAVQPERTRHRGQEEHPDCGELLHLCRKARSRSLATVSTLRSVDSQWLV